MALFGTDGIRGEAGTGDLAPERVVAVARAFARFARARFAPTGPLRVVLGRDPRPSGPALVRDLARGLSSEGATVEDAGMLPTPALAWLLADPSRHLGLAVSASHNPEAYNGVKPFAPGGRKLTQAEEAEIEGLVPGAAEPAPFPEAAPVERPAAGPYARDTAAWLAAEGDLQGWTLVADAAAGAAGATAPPVLAHLRARVEWLHPPGSRPINEECGTERPERWVDEVRRLGADGGLAFDGDGDRVLVADATGEILDGDAMLGLLAVDALRRGRLPGSVVVTTVMSNLGLEERMATLGIRVERVQVGDRNVAERMRETGAVLGAEPSGHVILPRGDALLGDALVAGVRVLQAARRLGRPLSALRRETPKYPQLLRSVRVANKPDLDGVPGLPEAIREAEAALGTRGRLLVRYSGTEPLLRIMAEGKERDVVERAVRRIEEAAGPLRG
jgi:phosphoglucosamine mutase